MTPSKSYFICFTVRSGSSLLCQLLEETGLVGKPKEHFYHNIHAGNPQGDLIPDYRAFLQQTLQTDTTPNGVFGSKVGGGIWHDFVRRIRTIDSYDQLPLREVLDDLFPDLHYIWLTRRNKVRQAVSHWMAIQSGRWHSPDAVSNAEPQYNYDAIDHLAQELLMREAVWADYFSDNYITPHIIVYEDYIQNPDDTVKGVLDFLKIAVPEGFSFPESKHTRLANSLSEEWVQRYRKEKQAEWWTTFY